MWQYMGFKSSHLIKTLIYIFVQYYHSPLNDDLHLWKLSTYWCKHRIWSSISTSIKLISTLYNFRTSHWGRSASALMASMFAWTNRQPNTLVPGALWSKSSVGRYTAWMISVESSRIQEIVFLKCEKADGYFVTFSYNTSRPMCIVHSQNY